jgi:hypothetical protein
VYPKVLYSDSGRDTVIQLSNTSNNVVYAHCFYVDARLLNGVQRWDVTDFRLVLTRQQPTHWVVSSGRQVNNSDNFSDPVMDGAGLDPGAIPPVQEGFQGELKCVQVDASGTPFGGNNLKGEAVLVSTAGDVSKYNALAVTANPDLASDGDPNELLFNNTEFNDGEYNSCANTIMIDHFADGADTCSGDDVCSVSPYLTVVPCQQDFENLIPESVTLQFEVVNEFENIFSTSTTADCWLDSRMVDIDGGGETGSIFSFAVLGTNTAFTRMTPVDVDGGVMVIAEELHSAEGDTDSAWAAWNVHQSGTRYEATIDVEGGPRIDRVRIPTPF